MVAGMDIFRRHFAGYEDSFVIIGGAACERRAAGARACERTLTALVGGFSSVSAKGTLMACASQSSAALVARYRQPSSLFSVDENGRRERITSSSGPFFLSPLEIP